MLWNYIFSERDCLIQCNVRIVKFCATYSRQGKKKLFDKCSPQISHVKFSGSLKGLFFVYCHQMQTRWGEMSGSRKTVFLLRRRIVELSLAKLLQQKCFCYINPLLGTLFQSCRIQGCASQVWLARTRANANTWSTSETSHFFVACVCVRLPHAANFAINFLAFGDRDSREMWEWARRDLFK